MGQPTTANELRICGQAESLGKIADDFVESYNDGKLSSHASYMDANGLFATKWTKSRKQGELSRKTAVYNATVEGPRLRACRLRMEEVACASCGTAGTKLKKCGRCMHTFYCSKEHQESVRPQVCFSLTFHDMALRFDLFLFVLTVMTFILVVGLWCDMFGFRSNHAFIHFPIALEPSSLGQLRPF